MRSPFATKAPASLTTWMTRAGCASLPVPPLSLEGPILSIRRFGIRLKAEDLIANNPDLFPQ